MRLRTEIVSLRTIDAGEIVGYNGSFRAQRPSRIAALPVGYGDGLVRFQSNRGHVLIRGQRCPIAGNISMDLTSVDVTDLPEVAIGDEAVLLGSQGEATIRVEEVAEACGTIPYEIFTAVSRRVPRFYG
jgi:alanine racemase